MLGSCTTTFSFFKEHEYLGNVSPAQKMGIKVPFKDWAEVLEQTKKDMIMPTEVEKRQIIHHLPIVHTYTRTRTKPIKPSETVTKVSSISTSSRIK